MKLATIVLILTLISSGCTWFADMPTGKGSYMWCYHQPQPTPVCRNYGFDDDDGDDE